MDEKRPTSSSDERDDVVQNTYIKPQHRKLHDPDITFEEYRYYADLTREAEKDLHSPKLRWREIINRRGRPEDTIENKEVTQVNFADHEKRISISDEEWVTANRAMRSASWGAAFYLITTDILGPYGVGFAIGTLGWGPGIALYTVFGFMAGYSGYLIWHTFLGLDSYEFPCRNYVSPPTTLFPSSNH